MTAPQPPNPTPTSTPESPAPTATAPVSGPPVTSTGPTWTAPPGSPEWLARLQPHEVAALAARGAEALQAPQTPTPAPVNPSGAPSIEDWIARPNEAAIAVADQRAAALMDPFQKSLQGMGTMLAATQRALAARDFSEDFAKWGPEIDGHMAQVPAEQRTLDNYAKVVKYVRGNHLDELVAEKAKALMATGGLTERSGGSNGGVVPTNGNGYNADKIGMLGETAKRYGLTEQQVHDFCRRNNMTVETWMKNAQDSKMFSSVSAFESVMSDEQLGIKGVFGE